MPTFSLDLIDSVGVLLFLDLSNKSSIENLDPFLEKVNEHCPDAKILLLGSKSDLDREVSTEEAQQFADEKGFPYIEVSAK